MDLPMAFLNEDSGLMFRLLQGLVGYDESQYREWLLSQPDSGEHGDKRSEDEKRRLSYHRWNQGMMILTQMRNMMSTDLNSRIKDKKDQIEPLLMPGSKDSKDKSIPTHATSLNDVAAMLRGLA